MSDSAKIYTQLLELMGELGKLKGKVEQLEKENEWLRSKVPSTPTKEEATRIQSSTFYEGDYYEEALRYKVLIRRMIPYSLHLADCPRYEASETFGPCECGLQKLLNELKCDGIGVG